MSKLSDSDNGIYYFIGNITSHALHALPLHRKLGGTFIVTSKSAKHHLEKYNIPVKCIDDVPFLWKWQGKRPRRQRDYIILDKKFKKTADYLDKHAKVVLFYELFEFSKDIELIKPKKIFLTHGNMLKNYLKMYPRRLEILKTYNYMAALVPFMKQEFLDSGIPEAKLIEISVARTDDVVAIGNKITVSESLQNIGVSNKKPIVSYMPTFWGDSSVETLGPKMLENISDDYTVLFRPHPQTPEKIIKKYNTSLLKPNVFYVPENGPESPSLLDIFAASSVIIGDVSSLMLEAILLDKPLIFAQPDTVSNIQPHNQIDEVMHYSQVVSQTSVEDINEVINLALKKGVNDELWQKTKSRCFYSHRGTSVKDIADFITSLV